MARWTGRRWEALRRLRETGRKLVMVTGLAAALDELGLSPRDAVAVGDAENDHAFLESCACSVAVANALPALKERAELVTACGHGAGVAELIDRLVADDLAGVAPA